MARKRNIVIICLSLTILIAIISIIFYNTEEIVDDNEQLVIYSSHPLEFMKPILAEFEAQTKIQTTIVTAGSGELLEQLEIEKAEPVADILWGGSLSTLNPQSYLFETYQSINENEIQAEFHNVEGMLTRFSDVPSILIVNKDLLGDIKISSYEDLLDSRLKGKIAYCSPSISSSAYEHLINMLYATGNQEIEKGWDYIRAFCRNLDGNLLKSSKEVYEGVEDGEYIVGLTFEEAAASMVAEGKQVEIVYMEEGVVSTPDCVCIIKEAQNLENAKKFVDFVTGYGAQNLLCKQLNRRSVRMDVEMPEYLKSKKEFKTIDVDREIVDLKKQEWIMKFRELFYFEEDNIEK